MSEPYADVPPGFYVREDADYGEVLVPVTAAGVSATDDSGRGACDCPDPDYPAADCPVEEHRAAFARWSAELRRPR